jgi:Flp pilus assembly protein TadB
MIIAVVVVVGLIILNMITTLINAIVTTLLITLLVIPASLLMMLLIPKIIYANRGFKLESKYLRLLYFLSTFIVAGLGITKALIRLKDFEELRDFNIELELIANEVHLGKDLDEVLHYVASITPCKSFASLLTTIGNVSKSGRDVLPVINYLIDNYFIDIRSRMEEVVDYVSILSEAFVVIALIFPLIVSIITSTSTLAPFGILDPYVLLIITTLLIVPSSSLAYYILVDYVMSVVQL